MCTCQPTFNAALIAFVEAARDNDLEKNRLCPPTPYPDTALDWVATTAVGLRAVRAWADQPDVVAWLERSRLNATRGLGGRAGEPEIQASLGRLLTNSEPAIDNLETLTAEAV